jgi:hypothetical protein
MYEDIIGVLEKKSDLTGEKVKVKYLEKASIAPGDNIQIRLPKLSNDPGTDLDKLFCSAMLKGTSTDANACIDGPTLASLISHIVVTCGSTTLLDIDRSDLLAIDLYDLNNEANTSVAQQYVQGDQTLAARKAVFALAAPGQNFIWKMFPRGSLFNKKGLLPLARCADVVINIFFNTAALSIYSPAPDNAATWALTKLELHMDLVRSPSLSAYWNKNGVRMSVTDYSYRSSSFTSMVTPQIQWAVTYSSLDKVYVILRPPATLGLIATQDKARTSIAGNLVLSYQCIVNTQNMFLEEIKGMGQGNYEQYEEFRSAFPQVYTALFFDASYYASTKNRIGIDFQSAPEEFRDLLVSGANTASFNNNVVFQPTFTSAQTAQCDAFLMATVTCFLDTDGELKIQR